MNVTIDISTAINEKAGIGRLTRNLVENLIKNSEINFQLFAIYFNKSPEKNILLNNYKRDNSQVKFIRMPGKLKEFILSNTLINPIKTIFPKNDIYHAPTFVSVPEKTENTVTTICDVAYDIFPDIVSKGYGNYFHKLTQRALSKSEKIITISNSTKKDLLKYYKVEEDKIKVIYPGIEKKFFIRIDKNVKNIIRRKFNVPEKFIFFVGTLEPRKNLSRIIKAFSLLKENIRKEFPLVITGAKGWLIEETIKESAKFIERKEIIFTGHVNDNELMALYQSATIFVFPTLYEGFGFPVLEAMASGTPVITSNVSSLKEISADAAKLVDPLNVDEISSALDLLLTDDKKRDICKRKGLEHAKKFNWEKCAEETIKIYKEIYAKN